MTDAQYGEPWKRGDDRAIENRDGDYIVFPNSHADFQASEEEVERIVACVNFCRGVPTETLNGMTLDDFGVDLSAVRSTPGNNS